MAHQTQQQERFLALFEPLYPDVERFVRALVRREREDAVLVQDVVAETIALAFERFGSPRDEQAFLSFLFTIATRVYRQHRVRARRFIRHEVHIEHVGLLADSYAESFPSPANAFDVERLYAALGKLPERQREALILFELLGHSMKEIADLQGDLVVTVKVRISRGRAALKRLLTESSSHICHEQAANNRQ
jgi:RNA polymerase sigma-70 factor (ECF subfamily)